MSLNFTLEAGVLSILGDLADDRLEIVDHGEGTISVEEPRGIPDFQGVEQINVQTNGGNDSVGYRLLLGERSQGPANLIIDLGSGDDSFQASAITDPGIIPSVALAPWTIRLAAGEGSDHVAFDIQSRILPFLEVHADLDLGAGDDLVSIDGTGTPFDGGAFVDPQHHTISVHGGDGEDVLRITTGPRADQFDIGPGTKINSCVIEAFDFGVSDVGTKIPVARYLSVDVETITTKAGDGNDVFNITGPLPTMLNLFGQGGDDTVTPTIAVVNVDDPSFPQLFDGGDGQDEFKLITTDFAEYVEILGVPNRTIPDPEIRVTDLATGVVTFEASVIGTEAITAEAGGGDDRFEIHWDNDLMAGLAEITANLGAGNDNAIIIIGGNVAFEGSLAVSLNMGAGNDQVSVEASGVRWAVDSFFDVFTDLGQGNDRFVANFQGPPDPVMPVAGRLHVKALGGQGNDDVALNFTSDSFFDIFTEVDLGAGNDSFRAVLNSPPDPIRPIAGQVTLNVLGAEGNDLVSVEARGVRWAVDSFFDVFADLGQGNDRFVANFQGPPEPITPPAGRLHVKASGGQGNDEVAVNFTSDSFFDIFTEVDLGAGNDSFRAVLNSPPEPIMPIAGQVQFNVLGQQGNDAMRLLMGDPKVMPLLLAGRLEVNLDGGTGADTILCSNNLNIARDAQARFRLDGGIGNDRVDAFFRLAAESEGSLAAEVLGGLGNDTLSLIALGGPDTAPGRSALLDLLVDGGRGFDRARATRNVTVKNCELVRFVG